MKHILTFATTLFFLLFFVLILQGSSAFAACQSGCGGCNECSNGGGTTQCSSCTYCSPGEGTCPANTSQPQPTQKGQPTNPPPPTIAGCTKTQPGGSCNSSGDCCTGGCNGGICGGGGGVIKCEDLWTRDHCLSNSTCEWVSGSTQCVAFGAPNNTEAGFCFGRNKCACIGEGLNCNEGGNDPCYWPGNGTSENMMHCVYKAGPPPASPTPDPTELKGKVFDDQNRDGVKQGTESYIGGVNISIVGPDQYSFKSSGSQIGTGYNYIKSNIEAADSYKVYEPTPSTGNWRLLECGDLVPTGAQQNTRYFICSENSTYAQIKRWWSGNVLDIATMPLYTDRDLDIPMVLSNRGRVSGAIFIDGNKNARKNAGDPCVGGTSITGGLLRLRNTTTNEIESVAPTSTCAQDSDIDNFNFGKLLNGSYAFTQPTLTGGLRMLNCSERSSANVSIPDAYFYCSVANHTGVQLWKWTNGDGNAQLQSSISLPVAGGPVRFFIPLVNDVTLTPTATPTISGPTATPTPTIPSGSLDWMQIVGGSVYQSTISQPGIPTGSKYLEHLYSSTDKSLGVLFYHNSIDLGEDNPDSYRLADLGTAYSMTTDFEDFKDKLSSKGSPGPGTLSGSQTSGVYTYEGDVTIANALNINPPLNGKSVVYIIGGNLIIDADVTVTSGKAVLFLVEGDIEVKSTVDTLEGVYFTNQQFQVDYDEDEAANPLSIRGMVYARTWVADREYGASNEPTYVIAYEPGFLVPLMEFMQYVGKSQVRWQEVAP